MKHPYSTVRAPLCASPPRIAITIDPSSLLSLHLPDDPSA
jgi:hypothetical protein